MKPTIGRIVRYASQPAPVGDVVLPLKIFAAIVTEVLEDDHVHLCVFFPQIGAAPILNVPYSETPADRTWSWPPRE